MARRHTNAILILLLASTAWVLGDTNGTWPPRAWLVDALVREVPGLLASQDPATGRFGGEPWGCQSQHAILPLAVAWATADPSNPHAHSEAVLTAICRGGDALVEAQDEEGAWAFPRRGQPAARLHLPWTYSRWVRAYGLIRDAMPAESRARWEDGLRRGFRAVRRGLDGPVQGIATHQAMALYLAGQALDEPGWQEAAARTLARVVAAQDPAGFWAENYGPALGSNMAFVEALGVYYAASGDASVLDALERAARFHAATLWPDGTPIAGIDERQIYHRERSVGNVGFSHTAAGRGYLLAQTEALRAADQPISAEYAAAMLLHGGSGPAEAALARVEAGQVVLGDHKAVVQRSRPWQLSFSAYCCPVSRQRWVLDRQNLVDVFHDDLGLILGGGNSKLQPLWSTFTVGDPQAVRHRPGDTSPEFTPRTDLRWVPTRGTLDVSKALPALELAYHDHTGRVSLEAAGLDGLRLAYTAVVHGGRRFEAHVPFLKRRGRLRFASGLQVYLSEEKACFSAEQTGAWFEWDGLRVGIPPGATLHWPARAYNPYARDGKAPLQHAKLVMTLPFTQAGQSFPVDLQPVPPPDLSGVLHEARRLPVTSRTDSRLKALDDLGSFLLAASRPGDSMTFSLPVETSGTYEFLVDLVMAPSYGVVQFSLDGTPVGEPFDAYAPELDVSGPVSLGEVLLVEGRHDIGVAISGRNPKASNCFVSVRSFRLKPRPAAPAPAAP